MKDQIPDPQHRGRKQVQGGSGSSFSDILPDSDYPESEEPEQEVDDENQELEAAVAAWQPHFTPTLGGEKNSWKQTDETRGGWDLTE